MLVILASLTIRRNITRELSIVVYLAALYVDVGICYKIILLSVIGVTLMGELDKETVILFMIGVGGVLVVADTIEFVPVYIGIELSGLAFYVLAGRERNSELGTEAALKYFALGALGSGLLLIGMTLLYAETGATELAGWERVWKEGQITPEKPLVSYSTLILVGLYFKLGVAPFHMWVADVYEGSSTKVTAYFAIVPKIAYISLLMLIGIWENIYIGTFSIVVGTIGAINQTSIKRMLAYSGIAHMGFILLALGTQTVAGVASVLIYYMVYAIMSLATFMIISSLGIEKIAELRGLSRRNGVLGMTLGILMMSMAGIPPLAGFLSKYLVLRLLVELKLTIYVVIPIVMSVIASFYYIRLIQYMSFEDKADVDKKLPVIGAVQAHVLGWAIYILVTILFCPSFVTEVVRLAMY